MLYVEENNERVVIKQRRFLRTDFIEKLRDTRFNYHFGNKKINSRSRWTIPIYYKIDGVEHMKIMPREGKISGKYSKKIAIPVKNFVLDIPANCSFSIDASYPLLYAVYYTNRVYFSTNISLKFMFF